MSDTCLCGISELYTTYEKSYNTCREAHRHSDLVLGDSYLVIADECASSSPDGSLKDPKSKSRTINAKAKVGREYKTYEANRNMWGQK